MSAKFWWDGRAYLITFTRASETEDAPWAYTIETARNPDLEEALALLGPDEKEHFDASTHTYTTQAEAAAEAVFIICSQDF